jgi:excisionase family DNA binding protein
VLPGPVPQVLPGPVPQVLPGPLPDKLPEVLPVGSHRGGRWSENNRRALIREVLSSNSSETHLTIFDIQSSFRRKCPDQKLQAWISAGKTQGNIDAHPRDGWATSRPRTEEASVSDRRTPPDDVQPAIRLRGRQGHQLATEEGAAQRLLLTVSEAAHLLGIGRSLLYELLAGGQVESIHVGRLRRIPADALATYIDRQRPNKPSTAM